MSRLFNISVLYKGIFGNTLNSLNLSMKYSILNSISFNLFYNEEGELKSKKGNNIWGIYLAF